MTKPLEIVTEVPTENSIKLGIAMTTELCYTDRVETNGYRGVLLLNAVDSTQYLLWAKRPLSGGFTSRCSSRQRRQPSRGRFVMSKEDDKKEKNRERSRRFREANPDYYRRYYEANQEKMREISRRYSESHPEKSSQRRRRFRENNPEYGLQWGQANPEKRAAYARRHREANLESELEKSRRYHRENRERIAEKSRRRRVRMAGSSGSHTEAEWQALCDYYMNQCLDCGDVPDLLTRDHVVPITKGGSDDIENIQPLCLSCNSRKNTKIIDYR